MSSRALAYLALAALGTFPTPPRARPLPARGALPLISNMPGWHALLIARARDCGSRIDFASVFEMPRTAVHFEGLAIADGGDGVGSNLLARLGVASPALVIYDASRTVRFAIEAPRTVAAADRLALWLVRG